MAITIEEQMNSREKTETASDKTLTRIFKVYGTDDPDAANGVGPQMGEKWDDELMVVERRFSGPIKPAGAGNEDGVLELVVRYYFTIPTQVGGEMPEFNLNVGVVSERVFKPPPKQILFGVEYDALVQAHYGDPNADDTAEPGDLINVKTDENGISVDGVDVLMPSTEYSETHGKSSFPTSQQMTIARLTAKVNSLVWRGWPVGTVLFLGAQANRRKGEDWRITYNFRIGVNAAHTLEVDTGEVITYNKGAHDYAWFRSSKVKDEDIIVWKIHDIHVASVYQPADFAELGLGSEEIS